MRNLLITLLLFVLYEFIICQEVISTPPSLAIPEEFKEKREQIFEFLEKPKLSRDGDKITIIFETKSLCDVTIAIEHGSGKVVRNLVSGVLGANAPEPLKKNSKKQVIVWDGKSDDGNYIDDKENCFIRVSLGLKPQFERNLFHSNYKLWGRNQPIISAAPEGVYVFEGDNLDSIKLYDHKGNYLHTVYPFPSNKIDQVKGLRWHNAIQDGAKIPFKEGFYQSTFFTSGYNSGYDKNSGFGVTHFPTIGMGWAENAPDFPAATAMAINAKQIALAGVLGINRLGTDGSSSGLELIGPKNILSATQKSYAGNEKIKLSPRSIAFSPNENWLYMTGYQWKDESIHYGGRQWLHSVFRVKFDSQDQPEVFIGSPKQESGNGPDSLYSPTAVTCDAKGNIYVADYGNNRVQVFSSERKLLESIPINHPVNLKVHPKTGDLYVFSWLLMWDYTNVTAHDKVAGVPAVLQILGPEGNRQNKGTYPLPFESYREKFSQYHELGGIQYQAELDPWADTPTIWVVPGAVWQPANAGETNISWMRGAIKIAILEKENKVNLIKEFGKETFKKTIRESPTSNGRQIMVVNPKNEKLYVLESLVSGREIIEIDPDSGIEKKIALPHDTDDFCFDMAGYIYLNTGSSISRFNLSDLREIPWDYGEERKVGGGHHGGPSVNMVSTLVLPGSIPPVDEKCHTCGMFMSPHDLLAVYCWNGEVNLEKKELKIKPVYEPGKKYTPPIYEGRQRWGEIHVWDKHGKVQYTDAVPGLGFTDGIAIDKEDNIYVMAGSVKNLNGENKLNPKSCTLMKFKPNKGKIITDGDIRVPVPLKNNLIPKGPFQMTSRTQPHAWVNGAEWIFGGVGYSGWEWSSRFALDLYARSFVPETDHFSIAVLDTNGNLILRIGKYGNIDDGKPLILDPDIKNVRSIGGDEVAIMHASYVGVQSDKRLFISDTGNRRITSVKLNYITEERLLLQEIITK